MLRLWRQCLVPVVISWVGFLLLAFAALALSLEPWLRTPGTSRAVMLPMMLVVFGRAAELATILGVPTGLALGARRWIDRNATNHAGAKGTLVMSCALGALVFTVGLAYVNVWSLTPGRVARAALMMARERCLQEPPRSVPISVLNAAWVCRVYASPRLEGTVPGGTQRISFSAENVRISDDLLSVDLEDFRLNSAGQSPNLHLHSPHATVHGARTALRPASLGPWLRAMLAATTGFLLAAVAVHRLAFRRWFNRRRVWLFALGSAIASALAFVLVDYGASTIVFAYLGVPVAGLAVMLLSERLLRFVDSRTPAFEHSRRRRGG